MGSTICTAGFPSAAITSSCFTARCDSIWYGFFIATLLFLGKENCSQPIKPESRESLLSTVYPAFPFQGGPSIKLYRASIPGRWLGLIWGDGGGVNLVQILK